MSVNNTDNNSNNEIAGRWYTVKEAAEYLGVSQPTIFRWMKDGVLSFYKIGGATRFSREGLEAVVEKVTGSKEAEAAQSRCAVCGHSVLVEGTIQSMGQMYFRPDKARFWTMEEALVPLRSRVCVACGNLQIVADTAKLNRLRTDADRARDAAAEPNDG